MALILGSTSYLLRTAHHTSLPYGTVDARYLLSQIALDNKNRIAFSMKAMRTAEHLLLSRYFDYTQVSYHKTTAGLEWLLEEAIYALLDKGALQCSEDDIKRKVEINEWCKFDDMQLFTQIRQLESDTDKSVADKAHALLHRTPPTLMASREIVANSNQKTETFTHVVEKVKAKVAEWEKQCEIDDTYWYVWERTPKFTASSTEDLDLDQKGEECVRVLNGERTSIPIVTEQSSLFYLLGNYRLFMLRIYVLFPNGKSSLKTIREIVEKDLTELWEEMNVRTDDAAK